MALRRPGRCVSFIRPQPRLNPVYNSRLFRSRDCYSSVKPWTRQALNPDAPAVWASVARPTMRPGDRPPSLTCATTSPWSRRFEELCLPLGAVAVHPLDSIPRQQQRAASSSPPLLIFMQQAMLTPSRCGDVHLPSPLPLTPSPLLGAPSHDRHSPWGPRWTRGWERGW